MLFQSILFYLFAAVMLGAAMGVVLSRNPVHAVMFLVLTFFQSAMLWLLAEAEFLAIVLILANLGLDGDRQRRAYRFAKLARDATFFAVWIAAQRVQTTKAMRLWRFFFRVLQRHAFLEKLPQSHRQSAEQFPQRERLDDTEYSTHLVIPPILTTDRPGTRPLPLPR